MPVENDWLRIDAKYLSCIRMELSLRHQFSDAYIPLIVRIDAYQRLWPEPASCVNSIDLFAYIQSTNFREGSRETFIVANY